MKNNSQKKGAAMITATIILMLLSVSLILGLINPIVRNLKVEHISYDSRLNYFTAEALNDDILYRTIQGLTVDSVESLSLNNSIAYATTSDIAGGKQILVGVDGALTRKASKLVLNEGIGATFFYGVQAGVGGFELWNQAVVNGNVYSNGRIIGDGSYITGDAVSAGADGLIEDVEVYGDARANTIKWSDIGGDAYYETIIGTLVDGDLHPNSIDPEPIGLPDFTEQIEILKDTAEAGGIVNCSGTYTIKDDETIGPKKYTCNLSIEKNGTDVTLTGPIWVEGNFYVSNESDLIVDASLAGQTVAIIADKESNRSTSSKIEIANASTYTGAGDNSYIMLVSMNDSASNGGGATAISTRNSVQGDLVLYAPNGKITLDNFSDVVEIAGYKVTTENHVVVNFEQGASSVTFSSGPSGGYTLGSWVGQ